VCSWQAVMRITVRKQAFSTVMRITIPRMSIPRLAGSSAYLINNVQEHRHPASWQKIIKGLIRFGTKWEKSEAK
jgi:hypothetical protein